MAITSPCQGEDTGSIPVTCSMKIIPLEEVVIFHGEKVMG